MSGTPRTALRFVSAALSIALLFVLAACTVQKQKEGSNEKVDIQTPVGALKVDTDTKAQETGLAVYPGAKPNPTPEGDHNSANVNIASSLFGVKVVALEYVTDDSPEKVADFYKKELSKYGDVLDCKNGVSEHGDELSCSTRDRENHQELAVGSKQRQHLVSIKHEGKGTRFGLVYVQVRGKEGSL